MRKILQSYLFMNTLHFNNCKAFRKNTQGQGEPQKLLNNCLPPKQYLEKKKVKIHLITVFEEFGLCFSVINKYAISISSIFTSGNSSSLLDTCTTSVLIAL